MFLKIQRIAAILAAFFCIVALAFELRLEPVFGVLISAAAFYATFFYSKLKQPETPQHNTHRGQLLWVLNHYHIEPLLAIRNHAIRAQIGDTVYELQNDSDLKYYLEQAFGKLLITGDRETRQTFLIRLMRELARLAATDANAQLPILLHVGSWDTNANDNMIDWVVEQAARQYNVPRDIILDWLAENKVALLLDGFDQLPNDLRQAALKTVQEFQHYNPDILTVVSVETESQLPFMNLSLLPSDVQLPDGATFVKARFASMDNPPYNEQETRHYLGWLAKQMQDRMLHTFFIENLNESWLTRFSNQINLWITATIFVSTWIIFTLVMGATVYFTDPINPDLEIEPRNPLESIETGGMIALIGCAIITAIVSGANTDLKSLEPKRLGLSTLRSTIGLYPPIILGFVPILGLLFGLTGTLANGIVEGVQIGVYSSLISIVGLVIVVLGKEIFTPGFIETNPEPNLHQHYAIYGAVRVLVGFAIFAGASYGISMGLETNDPSSGIYIGSLFGLIFALGGSIAAGGAALIYQLWVMYFLKREAHIPPRFTDFLKHTADLGFLVQVGSGYQFRNEELRGYFATAQPTTSTITSTEKHHYQFTVPHSIAEVRQLLMTTITSPNISKQYAMKNLKFNLEANNSFVFADFGDSESLPTVHAAGTITSLDNKNSQVYFRVTTSGFIYIAMIGGILMGLLFMSIVFDGSGDTSNFYCFLPMGIVFGAGGVAAWTTMENTRSKYAQIIQEALEAPFQIHRNKVAEKLNILIGLCFALAFILFLALGTIELHKTSPSLSSPVLFAIKLGIGLVILIVVLIVYSFTITASSFVLTFKATSKAKYNRSLLILSIEGWVNPANMLLFSNIHRGMKANILRTANKVAQAEALWQICLAKEGHDSSNRRLFLADLGELYLMQGDLDAAKPLLDEAYDLKKDSADLNISLAFYHLLKGDNPQVAIDYLDDAKRCLDPSISIFGRAFEFLEYTAPILQVHRSWAYVQLQDIDRANQILEQALQMPNENHIPGEARFYVLVAKVKKLLGDEADAKNFLKRAAQVDPHGFWGNKEL